MKHITICIEYAGLSLMVIKNQDGEDATPLKPISDLFGLRWNTQREKVTGSEFFARFFGVCTLPGRCADDQKRDQTCILVSRVAAYMMTINPEQVRAQGNTTGADFLETKLNEWADALHDYEQLGAAFNLNHAKAGEALRKQRASFAQMIGVKNRTAAEPDRKALGAVIGQMAAELGVPYQVDLVDEGGEPK